jgi:hypothetical protein
LQALEEVSVQCPYCGEFVELTVDRSMLGESHGEDCQVCCQPMVILASANEGGGLSVEARREDE